jgi:hypothetical protein
MLCSFSYYVSFLCISIHPFCLFTSELCVSFPMLGIIIVFVYIHCAVSVIGLVAVDSAHK